MGRGERILPDTCVGAQWSGKKGGLKDGGGGCRSLQERKQQALQPAEVGQREAGRCPEVACVRSAKAQGGARPALWGGREMESPEARVQRRREHREQGWGAQQEGRAPKAGASSFF